MLNVRIRCPWCMVFPAIHLLRAVSDHLDLLRPVQPPPEESDPKVLRQFDYERRVAELAFGEDADELGGLIAGGRDWMQLTDTEHCGKMSVLLSLLAIWHSQNDKVLVFSHRVRMLKIIRSYVEREQHP
ncbi:hypothetical protein Rsub_05095 [Raphidocelis subcapitata]|uniref:Uncharacterized protein n=1 Tax=Raphidocelis subcapitata TaxID=307507 RepID=A0A2V0NYN5_9CHLO|nr:hypothetical protein Rsub_05095 [Raphidocelis subcapitata]|eukprot:GBF92726.1 hypothetical protein Rsub_05095 [Raphidocelis subcapitata]